MEDKIIDRISETLSIKRDTLTPETKIQDIARDSMDIVEIIAVLSNEYKTTIDSAQMNNIETISDIISFIKKNQNTAEKQSLQSF